jgi:quercetin dioxygenase-like cupin family protein
MTFTPPLGADHSRWEVAGLTITSVSLPEGEPVRVLGAVHTIKVRHTAYTVIESIGAPGSGLPPHSLEGQDQSIYVLTGEYRLVTGDERLMLAPGSIALIPRGTVHSLTVSGTGAGRCLMIVNPHGAMETFLDELRAAARSADEHTNDVVKDAPDSGAGGADGVAGADEVFAIARRVGITLLTSPV